MENRVKTKRKKKIFKNYEDQPNLPQEILEYIFICYWLCLVMVTVMVPELQRTNFPAPLLGNHILSVVRDTLKVFEFYFERKLKPDKINNGTITQEKNKIIRKVKLGLKMDLLVGNIFNSWKTMTKQSSMTLSISKYLYLLDLLYSPALIFH